MHPHSGKQGHRPGTVRELPGRQGERPRHEERRGRHEEGATTPPRPGTGARRSWLPLLIVCTAQFMVLLDMSVTTIALPTIGRSLGFATGDLSWVVTSYLLATGGLTLLGGRAADLFGGRRMFLTGLTTFTLASLASGLSPSAAALLAARSVQGAGAALLTPAALSLVTAGYDGRRRAVALSVWGALAGGGVAAGTVLGGVLTSWLGWRSVFLVNVPVGVTALLAGRRVLAGIGGNTAPFPVPVGEPGATGSAVTRGAVTTGGLRGLDLRGTVLAVGGLVALDYAITRHGWGPSRTVPLAAAAVLLAAFALAERKSERGGRTPLVPLSVFRSRGLTLGGLALLAATGIQIGVVLLSSLFLQDVTGASAVLAGLEFLPPVLLTAAGAGMAAHLSGKTGTRPLAVAGFALLAGGALWLSQATATSGYAGGLLPGLLVLGAGSGLAFPSAQITGLGTVRAEIAGLAAGLMTTGHELGAALGAAVFPAVAAAAAGFAGGYRTAMLAAAITAAAFATVATVALPNVRPAPGTKVGLH